MNGKNLFKDPQSNWRYILIVAILAIIVGGGILGYLYWEVAKEISPLEFLAGGGPFNFFLTMNPGAGSVDAGNPISTIVTANLISGSAKNVSFSASGLPPEASISFSPTRCTPTCSSTLTIITTSATSPGTYSSAITGKSGRLVRTILYYLTVTTTPPTLSVSLSANPSSGSAPLNNVDLTATISGTATGTINYTFYCNRSDSGSNITPDYNHKKDGITLSPYTAVDVCNYSGPGTYTAKVIVERGSMVAENRTTIDVYRTLAQRGTTGDLWADVIVGQPDFSEINPGTVGNNNLWLPHGVIVDRASTPNKMYVYDAGHNRILGYNLGTCLARTTNPLNCPADIVIGQPSMNTSACNGDSGFQNYPDRATASASTLCGLKESQLSISEGGSGASMAIDSQGNLYVFDSWNHRVLKYYKPFETDRVADEVWGQNDFSGNKCNKGNSSPDATSLCYGWGRRNNWTAGVDVDSSVNLWVADSQNNRVLRFPAGSKTADLIFGQQNFTTDSFSSALNQFDAPVAVRVSSQGWVYVADQGNDRVLVFKPPFTSGMDGEVFGSGFFGPAGIDFNPTEPGKVWITDSGNNLLKLIDETSEIQIRQIGRPGDGNLLGDATGSIGIDSTGNIFIAIGVGDYSDEVLMFAKGAATDQPTKTLYWRLNNRVTAQGLLTAVGVAVANNQLIVADNRILFWNDPSSLTNGKPADGIVGVTDFKKSSIPGCCVTLKADKSGHLYVSLATAGDFAPRIEIYQLPLTTGAQPIKTIGNVSLSLGGANTLPLLGGGSIQFSGVSAALFGLTPAPDGQFLWVSEQRRNRVLRIRDPLTNPVVDVILGQIDPNGTECNRGSVAVADTLCWPGALSFDRNGNLYVSDHSLEIRGNYRLLIFNKELFPTNNTEVIYAPAASKIFQDIATWEPAFDSQNRMVVGYNPYWVANPGPENPDGSRPHQPGNGYFPGIYLDPMGPSTTPDAFLKDYHSMALSATFDENDNLYIGDLNRSRVLIYKKPF